MTSNCIIIGGARVQLPPEVLATGCRGGNYLDDGEPHFKAWKRKRPLDLFVLHETVGNTAGGCESTLLHSKSKLGVHFILGPDGWLSNHADVRDEYVYHAGVVNPRSIGIEVVNPYNPVFDAAPLEPTIDAQWWTWVPSAKNEDIQKLLNRKGWKMVPRKYCLPTDIQIAVLRAFVPWVCGVSGIPYVFPTAGLNKKKPTIDPAKMGPGVAAHRDWAHSDGRFLLEDLIARAA